MDGLRSRLSGTSIWEDRPRLVETRSLARADEVKIIGKEGDKIAVWKQAPGRAARVVWINATNVKKPEHGPYLIDPPEGTEKEAPAIGDLGDPDSFSGRVGDINARQPGKAIPEIGGLPTVKLQKIADKLKSLGIKPKDTFQKAVEKGEPLPTTLPEPA